MKMKILFIYHEDLTKRPLGSIGTYIYQLIQYAQTTSIREISYLGPVPESDPGKIFTRASYISYPPRKSLKKICPETLRIMKEFKKQKHLAKEALVSVHRWEQAIPFFQEKERGPVILTIHGSGAFTKIAYRQRPDLLIFHWLAERKALKGCDRIILISQDAFNYYSRKFPELKNKFRYIPTFVSDKAFYPEERSLAFKELGMPQAEEKIFLFAGRLVPEKNIPLMIKLTAQYNRESGPATLWIAGEGPDKEKLIEMTGRLGIRNKVLFWGALPHHKLIHLYNAANVLFLLSQFEGTPLTLLESLACGTPCLGTPVGDLPYIIKNGENGFTSPAEKEETLFEELKAIMSNEEQFQAAAINSAKSFLASTVIPQIIECYQECWQERER
jgi:glycosyltransferase involved in cell wall biosynthesis